MSDMRQLEIVIANLTESQAMAIEDMLAEWVRLGSIGASRWTCFFADGDGNFRPLISVNGGNPQMTTVLPRSDLWPKGHHGEYRIDFDLIAWALHEREEAG